MKFHPATTAMFEKRGLAAYKAELNNKLRACPTADCRITSKRVNDDLCPHCRAAVREFEECTK